MLRGLSVTPPHCLCSTHQLSVELLLILSLERRFQGLLEFTDLLLKFLDALLSFPLRLSEVDEFIDDGFLANALRIFSPMDYGKGRERRTIFSSSVWRLRRVFTVSRSESFNFFLVVSKLLVRLVSSLEGDVRTVLAWNEYCPYSFNCNIG